MPKVLLLQFATDPDRAARQAILQNLGVTLAVAEPRWPTFFDVVAAERPDVIVIAGSLFPTHAIEAARYLGDGFNTRNIPVIVVDVADNLERARSSAPRARIVDGVQLADAVRAALTKPIAT